MRAFYVADLNTKGELRQVAEYDYAALERIDAAPDIIVRCSAELWRRPDEFEIHLSERRNTVLRWRSTAQSAGVATVRRTNGDLVSISLLAAGQDHEADSTTISVLQTHLVRELKQTPFEPAFDLLEIKQRPLVASFTFAPNHDDAEHTVEALADRCFAASYFRFLGLA